MTATNKMRLVVYFCAFVLPVFVFLAQAHAANVEVGSVIKELFETKKVETGSTHLNQRMVELEEFYAGRSFKPIWVRDNGPKGKAKALLVELNRAEVHGLQPEFYRTKHLVKMMTSSDANELANLEMLMSGALIDYGYDLSNGHVSYQTAPSQVQVKPIIRSITDVIDGAEQAGDLREFVSSLLNVDDRYVRLLSKIAEMKRASLSGLWLEIPSNVPELELGESHPDIISIKTYLLLMGDFLVAEYSENAEFDQPLRQALLSYQARLGIPMTGKLDRETLDEISKPIERTIEKISINLERRRWQNREIGEKHIYVNLSDNQARLVIGDEKAGEFELSRQESDELLPTLYGKIASLALPQSGEGLQLIVVPELPNESPELRYQINLDGNTDELASLIVGQPTKLSQSDAKQINLPTPVNIFVTYVTAWANKDGSVHFRPDRYGRDVELEKSLSVN